MNRSGYEDGDDLWAFIRYRGQVKSAIRGRRGQAFLKELLNVLDNMSEKRLIRQNLKNQNGFCTLGVILENKNVDVSKIDDDDTRHIAEKLNISEALAKEIVFVNDEGNFGETPEQRWRWMRQWVAERIE